MKPELKKFLKARAHALSPVVITGQHGITPAVLTEIGVALDHHELIKIRVNAADREERREMVGEIVNATGAELIQSIGHIVALYRQNPEKRAGESKKPASRASRGGRAVGRGANSASRDRNPAGRGRNRR